MGKIINLYPEPSPAKPNNLFENAKDKYNKALVLGWDDASNLLAMSTSDLKVEEVLYMVKLFEHSLLSISDEGEI
tara:strand:- start:18248 stop:18472 length:225 start_codon:yes stop_codon:yes gene_type:complete